MKCTRFRSIERRRRRNRDDRRPTHVSVVIIFYFFFLILVDAFETNKRGLRAFARYPPGRFGIKARRTNRKRFAHCEDSTDNSFFPVVKRKRKKNVFLRKLSIAAVWYAVYGPGDLSPFSFTYSVVFILCAVVYTTIRRPVV